MSVSEKAERRNTVFVQTSITILFLNIIPGCHKSFLPVLICYIFSLFISSKNLCFKAIISYCLYPLSTLFHWSCHLLKYCMALLIISSSISVQFSSIIIGPWTEHLHRKLLASVSDITRFSSSLYCCQALLIFTLLNKT